MIKLSLHGVNCPACGQRIEAVARDGIVSGYCAVAKKKVSFKPSFETMRPWTKR